MQVKEKTKDSNFKQDLQYILRKTPKLISVFEKFDKESILSIEQVYFRYRTYKQLFPDLFKTNYDSLEELSDQIEAKILTNEKRSFVKKFISNKYQHLIDDTTIELFYSIKNCTNTLKTEEFNSSVVSKIASFKTCAEFNEHLKTTLDKLDVSWNVDSLVEQVLKYDGFVHYKDSNKILAGFISYEGVKNLGSPTWCIVRDPYTFNSYTRTSNEITIQYILFDTSIDRHQSNAILGITCTIDGKVTSNCDNKNRHFYIDETLNVLLNKKPYITDIALKTKNIYLLNKLGLINDINDILDSKTSFNMSDFYDLNQIYYRCVSSNLDHLLKISRDDNVRLNLLKLYKRSSDINKLIISKNTFSKDELVTIYNTSNSISISNESLHHILKNYDKSVFPNNDYYTQNAIRYFEKQALLQTMSESEVLNTIKNDTGLVYRDCWNQIFEKYPNINSDFGFSQNLFESNFVVYNQTEKPENFIKVIEKYKMKELLEILFKQNFKQNFNHSSINNYEQFLEVVAENINTKVDFDSFRELIHRNQDKSDYYVYQNLIVYLLKCNRINFSFREHTRLIDLSNKTNIVENIEFYISKHSDKVNYLYEHIISHFYTKSTIAIDYIVKNYPNHINLKPYKKTLKYIANLREDIYDETFHSIVFSKIPDLDFYKVLEENETCSGNFISYLKEYTNVDTSTERFVSFTFNQYYNKYHLKEYLRDRKDILVYPVKESNAILDHIVHMSNELKNITIKVDYDDIETILNRYKTPYWGLKNHKLYFTITEKEREDLVENIKNMKYKKLKNKFERETIIKLLENQ